MLKKIVVSILMLFGLGSASAQTFVNKLIASPVSTPLKVNGIDTLKILGVMVDFQEDKDAATFGNGKFGSIYSQDYGSTILDPLPHDKSYFDEHLEFVKNYYQRVSNGKLVIKYTVLPGIITVSQRMRSYSPPNNSEDFTLLGDFAKEVWAKVDSANPGFDFGDYNVFTVFHAGVGRDVTLPGSIGDQKDLPSVYLSTKALKNIFGNSFDGFSVSNGNTKIKNTMIIPETESREMSSLSGNVLFQLTINGLLVADIASHLGLPDLFDTKTGISAIGRFGLMDGQSIFAYNGLFPPEPSPWSKIYLGWADPVTLSPGNYDINIATQLAATLSDTTILKIPISSSEYFLVENRNRDANKDGSILTYVLDGQTHTKTFAKDTTGFYSYQVDSVQGVVTNVDEFDWAVPGNGIVIWHIDDNIIRANLSTNTINADINKRGVYVEEADGIWDIGQKFNTILGDVVIGEGEQADFWYKDNPSKLYQNMFSKDTRPNTNSNSGANSLITVSNFSNIANKMSFNVSYGDSIVKPIFSHELSLANKSEKLTTIQGSSKYSFALLNGTDLYILNGSGKIVDSLMNFSNYKVASVLYNNTNYIVGASGNNLNVYMDDGSAHYLSSQNINHTITAQPVIEQIGNYYKIVVGTDAGNLSSFSLGELPNTDPVEGAFATLNNSEAIINYVVDGGGYYIITTKNENGNTKFTLRGNGYSYDFADSVLQLAQTTDNSGSPITIVLNNANQFFVLKMNELVKQFTIKSANQIRSFALGDLKQDGSNYIIFNNGNKLDAVNTQGAEAENFPFEDPQNVGFTGTPLCADFAGNNNGEVIATTTDGRIFAIDGGTGKIVNSFPILSGYQLKTTPALFEDNGQISLAAINNNNTFKAWNIGLTKGNMYWSEENQNNFNNALLGRASQSEVNNSFFPKDKAYNYPNPVYGGETNIRYYVSEDSKIDIKIFDLAGDFVAELNDNAQGGMDHETKWDVNGIQSGVYIARIEAQSSSGKSESNIIKIAVIK